MARHAGQGGHREGVAPVQVRLDPLRAMRRVHAHGQDGGSFVDVAGQLRCDRARGRAPLELGAQGAQHWLLGRRDRRLRAREHRPLPDQQHERQAGLLGHVRAQGEHEPDAPGGSEGEGPDSISALVHAVRGAATCQLDAHHPHARVLGARADRGARGRALDQYDARLAHP